MRNHVRHNRSARTATALEEGRERDLVLAPVGSRFDEADEHGGDDADDDFADDIPRIDGADGADDYAADGEDDFSDFVRLTCPDCGRPIAVAGDDVVLPTHAVCPNPWQPFGLTVCAGSGSAITEAGPLEPLVVASAPDEFPVGPSVLPSGLNWRTQPFSHVGGPGSRPIPVPLPRAA
jgi:hypothetical protein